ncbi:MAG: lipopolysaccharide biosynthesis protein [Solirubrobacteraceae bacterium]|nr:lipopolysaccharide biosynthesis protein [Solirubrobacteraceae bacterium]
MSAPPRLAARTLRSLAWAYGSYVGGRALVLVSTVVLARLLTPADFGVVALALTFMVFLDTVKDLGLGQALIVAPDDELAERAQTAFGWSLTIGAGLSAATIAISPLAAAFFDAPALAAILAVLGLNFLLRSVGATHYALARRALDFRSRTLAELADASVRGVASITLALAGLGAWSLVLGYLLGTSALVATIWSRVAFRPRLRLQRAHLRELLTFGGTLTVVDIGHALAHEIDYLFIARILGVAPLGLYSVGFRLPELLIVNLAVVAGTVLFPAYALLDPDRLREAFLVSLRYTALLVLPVAVGLVLLARPVVLVLFGERWEAAIPVMQVLAAYAVVVTLNVPAGTVYKVTGRPWILIAFTVPYVAVLALALTFLTHLGIVAVAIVMAGLQGLFAAAGLLVSARILELTPGRILGTLAGPAAAATTMAVAIAFVARVVTEPTALLLAGGVAGAAGYALGVWTFAGDAVGRLREMAFGRRTTRPAAPTLSR